MITDNPSALTPPIRESKIIHKRSKQHPLARFITEYFSDALIKLQIVKNILSKSPSVL
jgi:hypothetical protein